VIHPAFIRLTAERDKHCKSILLVVERDIAGCGNGYTLTPILLSVERDTPCTSILLAVEMDTHCTPIQLVLVVVKGIPTNCMSKTASSGK
jgi:hypothetical protein